jgi:hypothetical protein
VHFFLFSNHRHNFKFDGTRMHASVRWKIWGLQELVNKSFFGYRMCTESGVDRQSYS